MEFVGKLQEVAGKGREAAEALRQHPQVKSTTGWIIESTVERTKRKAKSRISEEPGEPAGRTEPGSGEDLPESEPEA